MTECTQLLPQNGLFDAMITYSPDLQKLTAVDGNSTPIGTIQTLDSRQLSVEEYQKEDLPLEYQQTLANLLQKLKELNQELAKEVEDLDHDVTLLTLTPPTHSEAETEEKPPIQEQTQTCANNNALGSSIAKGVGSTLAAYAKGGGITTGAAAGTPVLPVIAAAVAVYGAYKFYQWWNSPTAASQPEVLNMESAVITREKTTEDAQKAVNEQLSQVNQKLLDREKKCQELQARLSQVCLDLLNSEKHSKELESAVSDHEKRHTELQAQLSQVQNQVNSLEAQIRNLTDKKSELEEKMRKMECNDTAQKNYIDVLTNIINELNRTIKFQQKLINETKGSFEKLLQQEQQNEQLIQEMRRALSELLHCMNE